MIDDETLMIRETAERLFADHCERAVIELAGAGTWPENLWTQVEETGLTLALVSEDSGGAGLDVKSALALIEVAAEYAAPIPLAETMIAAWLLDQAGIDVPSGPLTVAAVQGNAASGGGRWSLSGTASRVPWGARARLVAVAAHGDCARIFLLNQDEVESRRGGNVAGEPRDAVQINAIVDDARSAASPVSIAELRAVGAVMRTLQIAGALRKATALALQYAQDRSQFGRPLAKFQAIQQNLAVLATQAAVAGMSATMARDALASGKLLPWAAIAKARAGEAAGAGAAIAHQVHGAIGFTLEHDLQFYTKRLYAWRDEFGNEAEWNRVYGNHLAASGADDLWPIITGGTWETADAKI